MAEYTLRLRNVEPEELLTEEHVLQKDPESAALGPAERPEPYRTVSIAVARFAPVFAKEKVHSPLILQTPRGRGLLWRWWPDQLGVVLMKQVGKSWVLEEAVTFLRPEEREHVSIDFTQIVLNPPNWR